MNTRTIVSGLAALLLSACSLTPGGFIDKDRLVQKQPTPEQVQASQTKVEVQSIDPAYFNSIPEEAKKPTPCPLTCLTNDERKDYKYYIGAGDQLQIIVWDHPELTPQGASGGSNIPPLPGAGGASASGSAAGGASGSTGMPATAPAFGTVTSAGGGAGGGGGGGGGDFGGLTVRVASDGMIFFPRAGRIKVAGLEVQKVQAILTGRLKKTLRDPQVDVRVSGFNSQIVQVLGSVRNPLAQPITDVPPSIIDAINRSGGATQDADLQNVGVTRNGVRHRVDVAALLDEGNTQQNVLLKDGDIVDVPDRTNSRVFVLGEIVKPAIVPMNRGKLTLADALASSGSIDNKSSDPHFIYVIRGLAPDGKGTPGYNSTSPRDLNTPEVFSLDMTQVDALMLMTRFDLKPRDVVYVQIANSARFNRLLDLITPSLQTLFFTKELAP